MSSGKVGLRILRSKVSRKKMLEEFEESFLKYNWLAKRTLYPFMPDEVSFDDFKKYALGNKNALDHYYL